MSLKPEVVEEISGLAERAARAEHSLGLPANSTMTFAGRDWIRKDGVGWQLVEPLEERLLPLPKPYMLSTLKGLIEYIQSDIDGTRAARAVVHVESPWQVSVVGPTIGFQKQRPTYAIVRFLDEKHPWGSYQSLESFMVWLRSRFVPTKDSEALIKVLSGVKDAEVKNVVDTGLTQEVSIKVGVDMTDRGEVKNPVMLQPYRTFREVEQPQSEFLVRLQSGEKLPTVAVFEADGGSWQVEAITKIVRFLREGLGTEALVLS